MLNSHPRLAIPYESHFLASYFQRIGEYGDLGADESLSRLLADLLNEENVNRWDHSFDLERVLAGVRERSLAGAIDAVYRDYAGAKGKERWGDKSAYMDEIHLLNQIFADAQFIHLIRDGRDVASSVLKQSWGPSDIVEAAQWWNDHVWVVRRMGSILGSERYLEVRYEELIMDTENELRRVCTFLGESYEPAMQTYYEDSERRVPEEERRSLHYNIDKPPVRSRVQAWKREMSPYDIRLFGRHADRMLLELGYEVPSTAGRRIGLLWHVLKLVFRRLVEGSFLRGRPGGGSLDQNAG